MYLGFEILFIEDLPFHLAEFHTSFDAMNVIFSCFSRATLKMAASSVNE
jgi:hypothetical protein